MIEAVVDLTHSEQVLVRRGRELIRLDRQRVSLDPAIVEAARREIVALHPQGPGSFCFGYLLGLEDGTPAPAARELAARLQQEVVEPVGRCRGADFELSFLKTAEGPVPRAESGPLYAGYHLDTHPSITDDRGPELLRVLINLATAPRTLRYVAADRSELARAGAGVARSAYDVSAPPPRFARRAVDIPPFADGQISYLTFWASLVPHVGADRPDGHFLASFEAPVAGWAV